MPEMVDADRADGSRLLTGPTGLVESRVDQIPKNNNPGVKDSFTPTKNLRDLKLLPDKELSAFLNGAPVAKIPDDAAPLSVNGQRPSLSSLAEKH